MFIQLTYEELLEQARLLSIEDQLRLIEALAAIIRQQIIDLKRQSNSDKSKTDS